DPSRSLSSARRFCRVFVLNDSCPLSCGPMPSARRGSRLGLDPGTLGAVASWSPKNSKPGIGAYQKVRDSIRWRMANGKGQMANGKGQMADGRWQMVDGRWQMADGKGQRADGRWQMAD